jgi:uncharacterized membrane protein
MGRAISEYAALPIIDAYLMLNRGFQKAKKFREANATSEKVPKESAGTDDEKPSRRAYLVLAGVVVTLLVPMKLIGCLVSLLLNYAYLPVSLFLVGLILILQKVDWMEEDSTAKIHIFWFAFWPVLISSLMAFLTTANDLNQSTFFIGKLHFLHIKLSHLLN